MNVIYVVCWSSKGRKAIEQQNEVLIYWRKGWSQQKKLLQKNIKMRCDVTFKLAMGI